MITYVDVCRVCLRMLTNTHVCCCMSIVSSVNKLVATHVTYKDAAQPNNDYCTTVPPVIAIQLTMYAYAKTVC